MTRRRRSGAALVTAGVACLAVVALPQGYASADNEPGSALGSFNLAASAPVVQFEFNEPQYCFGTKAGSNGCEGVLPEAVSTLRNGPIGTGLAAVVWPGTLAASAGSLLITASSGQVPAGATVLNDPVKAEAHTSTGPDTVTYDSVPGTHMKAVAKDTEVSAEASISNATTTAVGTFGNLVGSTSTKLTGPKTAVATAHSSASDIVIAGVVHIAGVTSDAVATTDGTSAKVTGKTTVGAITIAGVPVSIDDKGITIGSTSLPLATATSLVRTAVAQLGMSISVAEPTGHPVGNSVTYNSGGLVFVWKPSAGYTATAVIGGANVSVVAYPGLPAFSFPPPAGGVFGGTTGTVPGGTGVAGPPSTGTISPPGNVGTGVTPPSVSDPGAPDPVLAAAHSRPGNGALSPWLAVLGLLGTGLVLAGMRRLPDRILEATASVCPLEETA